MEGAPMVQTMSNGADPFEHVKSVFISQTRRGCVQECFGCEATSEFFGYPGKNVVGNMENGNQPRKGEGQFTTQGYYFLEESTFFHRLCCAPCRPLKMTMYEGQGPQGRPLLIMHRPGTCPVGLCKCCCYQQMDVHNANDQRMGGIKETYQYCVPTFHVDVGGHLKYTVSQPTCWNGYCVDCCAEGCCNCRVPFYVYQPDDERLKNNHLGQITKIWTGLGQEVLTDASNFVVDFPVEATSQDKAILFGATMLLDLLFFEKN